MVTPEDLSNLRRLINEPENVDPYTDAKLRTRLESSSIPKVAREIWTEKAAAYADLTDVQEGSSRRALGDLHEQALKMAETIAANDPSSAPPKRRVGTRPIVRP